VIASGRLIATVSFFVVALAVLQTRQVVRTFRSLNPERLRMGTPAPPRDFKLADGTPLPADELAGRPVVVTFWAAWCAPCRMEMPELAEAVEGWNSHAEPKDRAVLVAVNQGDDPASVTMFTNDPRFKSVRFAFDKTGEAAEAWKVQGLPTLIVIDRNGSIAMTQVGYQPNSQYRVAGALSAARGPEKKP